MIKDGFWKEVIIRSEYWAQGNQANMGEGREKSTLAEETASAKDLKHECLEILEEEQGQFDSRGDK